MTSDHLDPATVDGLARLVRLTGRPAPDLLREAVLALLEDIEDARAGDTVLDRIDAGEERIMTLDELDRFLALDH